MKSWSPIIGHIIFSVQRPKRAVKALYFRGLGLGYIKRRITGGPIKGLWLIAGKHVFYSKSLWNGTYERDTCRFIQRVVPVNGVCYDIGANIGYHTLIMAISVGKRGLVYAFECIPNVCDVLRRNTQVNNIDNVVIVKKAVSRGSGTLILTQNIGIDQASLVDLSQEKLSTKIKNNPLQKTITCPAIKIDDFVTEGNRPPSFVKIDVEGAEVDVLAGAANTLKTHQPLVLCETHGRNRANEVYKMLVGLGYELFCVTESMVPIESMAQVPTNMQEGHVFARMKKT